MSQPKVIFDATSNVVLILGEVMVSTPATWNRIYAHELTPAVRTAVHLFDCELAVRGAVTHAKINAIKCIRRLSGAGLREAKEAYEQVERWGISVTREISSYLGSDSP